MPGQSPPATKATPAIAEGATTILLHEAGVENAYPRLSLNGNRILYQSNRTGKWQLYIMDIATKAQQRITHDAFNNNFVDWSADNAWIAFVSDRDGNEEILPHEGGRQQLGTPHQQPRTRHPSLLQPGRKVPPLQQHARERIAGHLPDRPRHA
ncbi:MAG: PD40 domain-containing protein [Flavobacteriales bacterium]|nr:PD40 domain-containing protein [Flavobacteriales bacterium]